MVLTLALEKNWVMFQLMLKKDLCLPHLFVSSAHLGDIHHKDIPGFHYYEPIGHHNLQLQHHILHSVLDQKKL